MANPSLTAEVIGVKGLTRLLRETDKKLARELQRSMRSAVQPMIAQARQFTPAESPLSGWDHAGRTGWRQSEVMSGLKVTVGGRSMRRNELPLLVLSQQNPAGMIYDWAGRSSYTGRKARSAGYRGRQSGHALRGQGRVMVAYLPRLGAFKGSKYSRVLFPAFVATRGDVIRAIIAAVDEMAAKVNIEIERVR